MQIMWCSREQSIQFIYKLGLFPITEVHTNGTTGTARIQRGQITKLTGIKIYLPWILVPKKFRLSSGECFDVLVIGGGATGS